MQQVLAAAPGTARTLQLLEARERHREDVKQARVPERHRRLAMQRE
jgi:hypothetical protein